MCKLSVQKGKLKGKSCERKTIDHFRSLVREADEVNQHRSESLTATYDMVVDNFICLF